MSQTGTENGNLKGDLEGKDLKAIIKNVDSKSPSSACPLSILPRATGKELMEIVSEEMQTRAVEVTSQALQQYNLERDIAMFIKKEFDRLYGTTWHCVVGKK
jgi:hypothetical protein